MLELVGVGVEVEVGVSVVLELVALLVETCTVELSEEPLPSSSKTTM